MFPEHISFGSPRGGKKRGRIISEAEVELVQTEQLAARMLDQASASNELIGRRVEHVRTDDSGRLVLSLSGGVTVEVEASRISGGGFRQAVAAENERQRGEALASFRDPVKEIGQNIMDARDQIDGQLDDMDSHIADAAEGLGEGL